MKVQITEREKSIIVKLANEGVPSPILAKAWGIPTQAIAAYRAWATMRSA